MEGVNKNREENIEGEKNVESILESSDIVVNPKTNLTIVVIKPDGFKNRENIIRRIENSGLYIVDKKVRKLPDRFVTESMYKNLPESIKIETIKHFNEGPSEIILVKGGKDMISKIVELTGEKTNPNECSEDTIRYMFGEHFSRITSEGTGYYRNAIHRPKDSEESTADLEKFREIT